MESGRKKSPLSEGPSWNQRLTLVHVSAQHKRFPWDRVAFRGCLGGTEGVSGVMRGCFREYFMSETAQDERKRGRV